VNICALGFFATNQFHALERVSLTEKYKRTNMLTDIFNDLDEVRIDQTFDDLSVEEVYTTIPCRKPSKSEFFRVNPDPKMREKFLLLEHQEAGTFGKDTYLVMPTIAKDIGDVPGIRPYLIVPCVVRPNDTPILWPVRLPNKTLGRADKWAMSALEVLKQAETRWVRILPDFQLQGHICSLPTAEWPEPAFKDLSLLDMLKVAFPEDRIIASSNHAVIKSLRGEI